MTLSDLVLHHIDTYLALLETCYDERCIKSLEEKDQLANVSKKMLAEVIMLNCPPHLRDRNEIYDILRQCSISYNIGKKDAHALVYKEDIFLAQRFYSASVDVPHPMLIELLLLLNRDYHAQEIDEELIKLFLLLPLHEYPCDKNILSSAMQKIDAYLHVYHSFYDFKLDKFDWAYYITFYEKALYEMAYGEKRVPV